MGVVLIPDVETLRSVYDLGDQDLALVAAIGQQLDPLLEDIIEDFYQWVQDFPEYQTHFPTKESTARVRSMQLAYWRAFFTAQVDDAYMAVRHRVGEVHAAISLSIHSYLSSMNKMVALFVDRLSEDLRTPEHLQALNKLVRIDSAVVISTLSEATNETIRRQSESIFEMSTPITNIWDGILLLPLVGIMDSTRSHSSMKAMLNQIQETSASVFILDISGVAVMDTSVANHLLNMSKASRLMGCKCIISGISPSVASTLVTLGVDVGEVLTRSSLKQALELAFELTDVVLQDSALPTPHDKAA